ncbi:MAG TPA: hypothetical protein VFZ24_08545 [Longimicrobiales bacterium]
MRVALWLATMLFFVAFFAYGYVLWSRSKQRRELRLQQRESEGSGAGAGEERPREG